MKRGVEEGKGGGFQGGKGPKVKIFGREGRAIHRGEEESKVSSASRTAGGTAWTPLSMPGAQLQSPNPRLLLWACPCASLCDQRGN